MLFYKHELTTFISLMINITRHHGYGCSAMMRYKQIFKIFGFHSFVIRSVGIYYGLLNFRNHLFHNFMINIELDSCFKETMNYSL